MPPLKLGARQINETVSRVQSLGQAYTFGFLTDQSDDVYTRDSQIGLSVLAKQFRQSNDGSRVYEDNDFGTVGIGDSDHRFKATNSGSTLYLGNVTGGQDKTQYYLTQDQNRLKFLPITTGGVMGTPANRSFIIGFNTDDVTGLSYSDEIGGVVRTITISPYQLMLNSDTSNQIFLNTSGLSVENVVSLGNTGVSFGSVGTGFTRTGGNMVSEEPLLASEAPDGTDPLQYRTFGNEVDTSGLADGAVSYDKMDQYAASYSGLFVVSGTNGDTEINLSGISQTFIDNRIVSIFVNAIKTGVGGVEQKPQVIDKWFLQDDGGIDIFIDGGLVFPFGTGGDVEVTIITRNRQGQ